MSEPLPLWDRLGVALQTYMTFAQEFPELYQLVFERPVPGFTPSEDSMKANLSLLAEAYALVEDAFHAEGITLPLPANQATDLIAALQHGLTALHMANEPHLPPGDGRFGALIPSAVQLFKSAWAANSSDDLGREK